ncbi:DUF3868 domain-containing protein [Dysgonomonas termitidis]|uniref:DUF3868 domain-containing protein n=1 Tax=Dysgonomonas termitidis TaxID=1516126 RepID=A0ABV9L3I2_9BACT
MKKILNIGIIVLLFVLAMPLMSQQIYKGQISIASGEMIREGDFLYVHMIIDMSGLRLDKNRSLTLAPLLTNGSHDKELPDVLINGTTRHKAYLRAQALGGGKSANTSYSVVKLDRKSKGPLHYKQTIPYEKWMDTAHLDMKEVLCGCGGYEQEVAMERVIENVPPLVITPYIMIPQLAYIQPKVEDVKSRKEQWDVYLDFPVNKTDILSDYMGNPVELSKIERMLKAVKADNNLTVTRIDISGYASPEGLVGDNEKLSRGRAEAFKKYLASKLDFSAGIYKVEYGGENWDGLLAALEASDMEDKDAVIDIIKNTRDLATRKARLRGLNNGLPYQQMLKEIYPRLRKVESSAIYNVKGFDVAEAKEVIKSRPQQLSLDEMFRIANSYEAGSNDFIDVFETAVRMFPDDEIANLNAAAAALSANNPVNAEKYLKKSNVNSAEYANNIGVLYLLSGDVDRAKIQFGKAAESGIEAAKYNLKEVEKKIENDAQIK